MENNVIEREEEKATEETNKEKEEKVKLDNYLLTLANTILKEDIKTKELNENKLIQITQLHPLSFNSSIKKTKASTIKNLNKIKVTLNSFKKQLNQENLIQQDNNNSQQNNINLSQQSNINLSQQSNINLSQQNSNLPIRKLFALLRESSHHLNLLIQSNSLINLNQSQLHPPSTYLNPSIILQNLKADQRFPTSLHLIESITRHLGLESFRDLDHSNLLTIAGKLIVIDVEIITHSADSIPTTRSKFSYTFNGELEPRRDPLIDLELTQLLSNLHLTFQSNPPHSFCNLENLNLVQSSLNAFTESLLQLKDLDESMVFFNRSNNDDDNDEPSSSLTSSASSIDFFRVFRQLINDYHQCYQDELKKIQDQNQQKQKQFSTTNQIHEITSKGVPTTSINQFKLELIYHHSSNNVSNKKISVSPTPLDAHQDTCANNSDSDVFGNKSTKIPMEKNQEEGPKNLFTAYFSPPLVVSRHTAAALARLSNQSSQVPPPIDSNLDHHPLSQNSGLNHTEICIENLLIHFSMLQSEKEFNWLLETNWKNKKFGKKFDGNQNQVGIDSINQVYNFLDETPIEIENLNDRIGFLISQISFNDLNSLLEIIKICQRQSILNELFQSCFNPDCFLRSTSPNKHLHQYQGQDQSSSTNQKNSDLEDDFATFYTSSNSDPRLDALDDEEAESKEISIDLMMNQAEYTITIQFTLPILSKKEQRKMKEEMNNNPISSSDMLEIDKLTLISFKLFVDDDLNIELLDFNHSTSSLSSSHNLNLDLDLNDDHDNEDQMTTHDDLLNDDLNTKFLLHHDLFLSLLLQNRDIPSFLNSVLEKF